MYRINTPADVANTGRVHIDTGDGVQIEVPMTPVPNLAARLAALEYDSGERDITSLIPVEVLSGALHTWRTGKTVWLDFRDLEVEDPSASYHSWSGMLPSGFRVARSFQYLPLAPQLTTGTPGPVRLDRNGGIVIYNAKPNRRMTGLISFPTPDAPPSSPPGSPA